MVYFDEIESGRNMPRTETPQHNQHSCKGNQLGKIQHQPMPPLPLPPPVLFPPPLPVPSPLQLRYPAGGDVPLLGGPMVTQPGGVWGVWGGGGGALRAGSPKPMRATVWSGVLHDVNGHWTRCTCQQCRCCASFWCPSLSHHAGCFFLSTVFFLFPPLLSVTLQPPAVAPQPLAVTLQPPSVSPQPALCYP